MVDTELIQSAFAGVGRGNGSDLSMEIIVDKKEIMKCIFGEEYQCKVRKENQKNVCGG